MLTANQQALPARALVIDTTTEAGRLAMRTAAWRSMFEREVAPYLHQVRVRLADHRTVQAKVAAGTLSPHGYFRGVAHSRAELVEVVRRAKAVRSDFLARWPEPRASVAASKVAA